MCDNLEHLSLASISAVMDKKKSIQDKNPKKQKARQETQKRGLRKNKSKRPARNPTKGWPRQKLGLQNNEQKQKPAKTSQMGVLGKS